MKPIRHEDFATSVSLGAIDGHSIAAKLIEIAHHLCVPLGEVQARTASAAPADIDSPARLVRLASEELRRRQARPQHLPGDLFGEGGWAILLDLFVSQHKGQKVPTMSACIAAGVPERTALNALLALEEYGLVVRTPDDNDKRVRYVSLTSKGYEAVHKVLSSYRD